MRKSSGIERISWVESPTRIEPPATFFGDETLKQKRPRQSGRRRRGSGQSPAPKESTPRTQSPQSRPKWLAWALVSLLLLALIGWSAARLLMTIPPPPTPLNFAALEPDVARLIRSKLESARAEPDSAQARAELAYAYEANAMWAPAAQAYTQAVALNDQQPIWTYHRAIALYESGLRGEAIESLQRLVKGPVNDPSWQHRFGVWLTEEGQFDEARRALERARTLAPQSPYPLVALASLDIQVGHPGKAVDRLEPIIRQMPEYKEAVYTLGRAYLASGQRAKAQPFLAAGLDAVPQYMADQLTPILDQYHVDAGAVLTQAIAAATAGDAQRAIRRLESLLAEKPAHTGALNNLAMLYKDQGRTADAMKLLRRAAEVDPESFVPWLNMSACALDAREFEDALGFAERAATFAPHVSRVHLNRAKALYNLDRYAAALAALDRSMELGTRSFDAYVLAGESAIRLDQWDRARRYYRDATRYNAESAYAWAQLSLVESQIGDWQAAEDALHQARLRDRNHAAVRRAQQRLESARVE